jgi:choline kinase
MTRVAGEPLIHRASRLLAAAGVRELVVVLGYQEDVVRAALADAPLPVRFVTNELYAETQTFYSLMLTRPLVEGEPFLKLNGDVIFESEVLTRLIGAAAPLALAVDERVRLDEEAMKIECHGDGSVARIGKGLEIARSMGESIGIEKIGVDAQPVLFRQLEAAAAAGERKLYYEDVFQRAIDADRLRFEPVCIGGLRWAEIDDEKDFARARRLFEAEPIVENAESAARLSE